MIEIQSGGSRLKQAQLRYLQNSDLLVHQAISLADRETAAILLFDAAVQALQLDMNGETAISVVRKWAAALKVGE